MKDKIIDNLKQIERTKNVEIILACESGSRAWGFPSTNSDYDVRFIYVHPKEWYLSVTEKRDVIELPVDAVLDIAGWDLRKSLRLLRKSNSALLEWLSSPIRYHVNEKMLPPILHLAKRAFLPEHSCYHYLMLAKNSAAKLKSAETARAKTYMYAIRAVLCCRWIIENLSQPPILIDDLLAAVLPDEEICDHVKQMITIKKKQPENYTISRSAVIERYINEQLADMENNIPKNPSKLSVDEFDCVFKEILDH